MKTFKVETSARLGVDGKLTAEGIGELEAKMRATIEGATDPEERARCEATLEKFLSDCKSLTVHEMRLKSQLTLVDRIMEQLADLPQALQSLAQHSDVAPHIFDLGGAYQNALLALTLLSMVRDSLDHQASCKGAHEPAKKDLS